MLLGISVLFLCHLSASLPEAGRDVSLSAIVFSRRTHMIRQEGYFDVRLAKLCCHCVGRHANLTPSSYEMVVSTTTASIM